MQLALELVGKSYDTAFGDERVRRNNCTEDEAVSIGNEEEEGSRFTYLAREDLFQDDGQRSCE